ncbi:hypothetical protein RUND412_009762 [Rhizina undulata]
MEARLEGTVYSLTQQFLAAEPEIFEKWCCVREDGNWPEARARTEVFLASVNDISEDYCLDTLGQHNLSIPAGIHRSDRFGTYNEVSYPEFMGIVFDQRIPHGYMTPKDLESSMHCRYVNIYYVEVERKGAKAPVLGT